MRRVTRYVRNPFDKRRQMCTHMLLSFSHFLLRHHHFPTSIHIPPPTQPTTNSTHSHYEKCEMNPFFGWGREDTAAHQPPSPAYS